MRVFRLACVVCAAGVLAVSLAACGGSKEEEAAKEAGQAAATAAEGAGAALGAAGSAAKAAGGLNELARSMEEASKGFAAIGAGNATPVEPVSCRELQKFFPEISGWDRGTPEGEKMTSPVSFSQSEVEYTSGESRLTAKIVDSGLNQVIFAPLMMFMIQGYEKESGHGYEKSVSVGGAPGFEKWDSDDKSGELTLVVGKRFVVELKAWGVRDTRLLHDVAAKIDMNGLANLK